eukprot:4769815-Pleurochrysis_carterae.AAC.1
MKHTSRGGVTISASLVDTSRLLLEVKEASTQGFVRERHRQRRACGVRAVALPAVHVCLDDRHF